MTSKEEARIRKILQNAKPAEKVVQLVLNPGIQKQIEDLDAELIEVRKEADTLAGNPEALVVADKIDALVKEAEASVIRVTIRQLPRKQWSDLKAKHPPADPRMYLYDKAIFEDAVPAAWVSPEIADETRDSILEKVTDGQWEKLCQAVQVTNGDVAVPFSALATLTRRGSGASEPQPEPTE